MPDMGSVDRLLAENLMQGAAAGAFHDSRTRVAQRHGNWRANFPAFGLLLDGDEERAQALAGNYATEARETVEAWLSAQESAPPSASSIEQRVAWIEAYWEAWRAAVFGSDDFAALEEEPRHRFTSSFDQLMDRFRDAAVAFVRHGGLPGDTSPSLIERLSSPARRCARAIASFFFPSVNR